jgi:hypothetical protein
MFARAAARAARRGWSAASVPGASSRVEAPSASDATFSGVRAARWTFAATMATVPLAVEAGSHAASYGSAMLSPDDLRRIAHDLGAKKRTRIEGPNVPRARAVLVPLCHDEATGAPHVLFTVAPDDFGAPHVGFPGAPIARTVRPRDAHSVSSAIRAAFDALGIAGVSQTLPLNTSEQTSASPASETRAKESAASSDALFDRLEILGLTSDCPDVPRQTAVTPVVGYLGRLDVNALERLSKARAADPTRKSPTLMAIALEELLSRESVDARVVPGVGPMPVFNAHAPPERPLQIWGLTAQILHAVMRVVVGPRAEYADALYGPFMRKTRSNA